MASWVSVTSQLGLSYPGAVDSTQLAPVGTVARFRNETLGEGEFIYLAGAANVDAGDVCQYEIDYNASVATSTVAPWVGTANLPFSLCVATAATVADTWGWYQIGGSAVVNSSGSITDGDDLFWQAAGVVSATLVAGKQLMNASAASDNGVPATNKVIVTLDRPMAQGVGDNSIAVGNITGLGTGVAAALAINTGSAGAVALLGAGSAPPTGLTASPRMIATGGLPADAAGSGNDSTPVITETYVSEIFIPCNMTVTGVALFNGSDVTGNVTVGLATSAGAPIAAAQSASTAGSGTDAYQRVPFAAPYAALGPATYYLQVQYDSGTARYNTHTVGNFGVLVQTAQTYGALTSFTPPTTFVTNVANIASLY
jgi:hypothetical protein